MFALFEDDADPIIITNIGLIRSSPSEGVRLGVFRPWFEDADPIIVAACERALDFLISKGAEVVPIVIPNVRQ